MPMVLKHWEPNFNFKRDMIRIILVWVELPNLLFPLWGASSLGKIGSAIGRPLFMGECTANKLGISFARILVEIDITKKQKDNIIIKDNEGNRFEQQLEFEWKPKYCDVCQKVGHHYEKEKCNIQKKWKPKVPVEMQKKPKEIRTPNNPIEGPANDWTQVVSRRMKGKAILQKVIVETEIPCTNVFISLRNVVDPIVGTEHVP